MHTAAELETGLIELEHRLRIVMAQMADFVAAAEREGAFVTDGFRTAKS